MYALKAANSTIATMVTLIQKLQKCVSALVSCGPIIASRRAADYVDQSTASGRMF